MRINQNVRLCGFLAIALAFSPGVLASAQQVPVKGSLVGSESDPYDPQTNTIHVQGTGSGTATHLGRYAVEYEITVNLATGSGPAHARFIAANGDILLVDGQGQASDTDVEGVVKIHEDFTIVGGTGRFAGVTGSVIVDRVLTLATGVTYGSLSGNLVLH